MLGKSVAVFVCLAFLVTSVYLPHARAEVAPIPALNFRSLTDDLTAIALPKEIGKIQDIHRGSGDKVVVLIQDAHSIPDAQHSIRSAIDYFQTKYGISLVGLEGASEKLDPQIFRSFPDKELLRKTFEAYAARGELTGGTAAALFNASPATYHGIEDWPLYEEGVSHYLQAVKIEPEIKALLDPMEAALTREKETVYSKELLEIDRLLADFGRNKTDLVQVLNKLAEYEPPPKGSELAVLLEEIRQSQMTDTPVEIEIKKIAEQVMVALKSQPLNSATRQELQEFNGHFQEFRTGRTTPQAFAFYLKGLAKKHGVRVKVSRKLAYLTEHQKRLKDIEGTRLFEDFKRYADSVKESLFQNEEQKALDIKSRGLDLIKRLTRLELSFEDWENVQKMMLQLDQWTVTQDRVVSREEMSAVLKKMEPHLAFYRIAEKRDKVFLENIRSMMAKAKQESSLLVAGGFHTEGLTRELKGKGISYVLVMPRIGSIPEEPLYREHMQGQVSWSNYFEVKDGKVNLYDAFVRATRDTLLGDKNASATSGKEWRDQIIRDLAAEGRITEAGDYTRFVDELTQRSSLSTQSLREKWLSNIDRFSEGLEKLKTEGNLSESSILQLIKTITIPEVSLANQMAPDGRAEIRLLPSIRGSESPSIAQRGRPETRRSELRLEPSGILAPYKQTESIDFEGLKLEVPAVFKQAMTEMMPALIFFEKHFSSDRNAMMRAADILKLLAKRIGISSVQIKIIISDSSYIDVSEDGDCLEISLDRFRIANEGFCPYLSRVLGGTIRPLLDNNSVSFRRDVLREVIEKNREQLKFGRYLQNEGFGYELPDQGKRSYYSGMRIERLREIAKKGKIEGKKPDQLVFTLGDDSATSLWLTDDVGLAEWHGRAGTGAAVRFKKENIKRDYQTRPGWQKGLSNEVLLLNQDGAGALEMPFTTEYVEEILAFDIATYDELTDLFPDIPIRRIATPEEAESYLREKGEMTNADLAAFYTSPKELARQANVVDRRTLSILVDILGMNMPALALLSPRELYDAVYQKVFFDLIEVSRQIKYIREKVKRLEDLQIQKRFGSASMTAELERELGELTNQYDFKAFPEKRNKLIDLYGKSAMLSDLKESFLEQRQLLVEAESYIFQLANDLPDNPDTNIMFVPPTTLELNAGHINGVVSIGGSERVVVSVGAYEYVFVPKSDQVLGYARYAQNGVDVGPSHWLDYFKPFVYKGEGLNFSIQIDVVGVDKYKVSITHLDNQGTTRIATEYFSRSEQRVAEKASVETVAGQVAEALKPGAVNPLGGAEAGAIVQSVEVIGVSEFVARMVATAEIQLEAAARNASRAPSVVLVTDVMARDFIGKISAGLRNFLQVFNLKGNITAVIDQDPDKNFLEALRAIRFGIDTVVFPSDKAQRLNRGDLDGLIVQTVRSLGTFNPVAAENRGAIPVVGEDLGAGYFSNENLFGVGHQTEGIEGETFLEVVENVARIAAGIVYAQLKMKGRAPSAGEINAELCKLLFQLDVAQDQPVFSMNGRHLVVHRGALLAAIQSAYLAQSETQKSA